MGQAADELPLRLGVSACLLGERVRYDGEHKRDAFLCDELGPRVEWVSVCPEVELGLGVPRETVRLEQRAGEVRLVAPGSGRDLTAAMTLYAARRLDELAGLRLSGFVLKRDSPSCGLLRVRVHGPEGEAARRTGRGLFAAALRQRLPDLPVEEEGRLAEPHLRAAFLERVFAHHRLQQDRLRDGE